MTGLFVRAINPPWSWISWNSRSVEENVEMFLVLITKEYYQDMHRIAETAFFN